MPKYLVVSENDDEQQWYHDAVEADSESAARGIVLDARKSYVSHAIAYTIAELSDFARWLDSCTALSRSARELAARIGEPLEDE